MQRIYEPESLLEAEMLAGMLASEGVKSTWSAATWSVPPASCRCKACWGWPWLMSRPNTHDS